MTCRSSKSIKQLLRYSNLSFFSKMAAVCHLRFVVHILGWPTKTLGCLYNCAKFDWHHCSSLILWVWMLCLFGLKMSIHAPKMEVLGTFDPQNWVQYQRDSKRVHSCMETRHMTYKLPKSVYWCRLCARSQEKIRLRNLNICLLRPPTYCHSST